MQLDRSIDYFLTAKQAERRTPATLRSYERSLFRFAKVSNVAEVEDIDKYVIREYIIRLQNAGTSDVTVAKEIRHLKAFVTWCVGDQLIRNNPFGRQPDGSKGVMVPSFDQRNVDTLSTADFEAMLARCDLSTAIGRRDAAMLCFLFDTGVRVSEMCGLRVSDIDLKARRAVVMGKGRKERTVFFSAQTALALSRHINRGRVTEYLFVGHRRNRAGYLAPNGVTQRFRSLARQAGVKARVNPHTFRHTFATNYLRLGGDPHSLQRILGHKDVSTTIRNYAHLVTEDLAAKHDQFSPVARLVGGKR